MEYFELARKAQSQKDYQKAFEYYTLGSNNDPSCLFGVGLCYKKGIFVKKNDLKAEELFEKSLQKIQLAAFNGDKNSSLALYYIYNNGYGCNKDLAKAQMFLEMAVKYGSIEATFISCGLSGDLAYVSTNEMVTSLKDVTDEKILKRLYDVFNVNDENSPLKYTLEALMFDLEYRQKVVFPNNTESIELDELSILEEETKNSEVELSMDWDSAFSSKVV